jgi:hypothetical protein
VESVLPLSTMRILFAQDNLFKMRPIFGASLKVRIRTVI